MGNTPKVKADEKTSAIHFNLEKPLERTQGESKRANAALHDYVYMGPGRSLRKLHARYLGQANSASGAKPPSTFLTTIENWSAHFWWQERLAVWEKIQAQEKEHLWAERRKQQCDEEWELHDELAKLARQILAESPKFLKSTRRVVKSTGQEIITLALDTNFLVKAIDLSSKLGRLAAGMDTERQRLEHSGPGGGAIQIAPDLSGLDDEQLCIALERIGNVAISLATGAGLPPDAAARANGNSESEKPRETDS